MMMTIIIVIIIIIFIIIITLIIIKTEYTSFLYKGGRATSSWNEITSNINKNITPSKE